MDPQGNATSGLGIDKTAISSSTYNLLLEQTPLSEVVFQTQIQNLWISPSNISLTGAEIELVGVMGREYKLKKALSDVESQYDIVMIDCPPSLGLITVNALCAANSTLIPIQCEYYALEGLGQLINTIHLVRDNLNQSLVIEGVVLTMADYRTKLTQEVIDEVKQFFLSGTTGHNLGSVKVYETVIPRNIRLTEAPGFGKPILLYDNHSIGARKYEDLANEMLGVKKVQMEEIIADTSTEEQVQQ